MDSRTLLSNCIKGLDAPRFAAAVIDAGAWILDRNAVSMDEMLGSEDCGVSLISEFDGMFGFDIVWAAPATYNYVVGALGGEVDGSRKGFAPELVRSFLESPDRVPDWDSGEIRRMLLADGSIRRMIAQTEGIRAVYSGRKHIAVNYIGPVTLASQLTGMTEFMMMLLDGDESLVSLLELALRICAAFYGIMTEAGADLCFIGDPSSSGDLISPEMFGEYSLPYIKRLCSAIRPLTDIILLHICGKTGDRIRLLRGSGIDALSLDRLDIGYALEESGGDFAVFGNVPPVDVLSEKSSGEVLRYCEELLDKRSKGDRFVLCPGCDLPPGTPEDNIRALSDAVRNCA